MDIIEILQKTFLFCGMEKEEISQLLCEKEIKVERFLRGRIIYSRDNNDKKVGFVINGCCEVRKVKNGACDALLNILSVGDSFGILSIYSDDRFPTQIYAPKNCEILFFTKEEIQQYVNINSQITDNLIKFLTNRINFLNEKISILSSTHVEERLLEYLVFEAKRQGTTEFHFNITKASNAINAGRASVYRAIESLDSENIISLSDKKIIINDLKGLERKTI